VHDLSLVRRLCHPKFGIGADGLVLLQRNGNDFSMQFFNQDGTVAAQCGNALLCLGQFIRYLGDQGPYLIQTPSGARHVRFQGNKVIASLGIPQVLHWDILIEGQRCFVIDTGVPHVVVMNNPGDFQENSRKMRYHPLFSPSGANVNWVEVVQEKIVKIRTYERGVEGETLSCGTGAAAAGFVLSKLYGWEGKLEMVFESQEKIDVYITSGVEIAGEPKCVFKGQFLI
jgi:diaminopimelate epimerase